MHSKPRFPTRCTMNSINSKIKSYVGLAIRSGSVLFGEDKITEKISACAVVLIDSSATVKYITRMTTRCSSVPTFVLDGVSDATCRPEVLSVAITNDGLAKAIIENLR